METDIKIPPVCIFPRKCMREYFLERLAELKASKRESESIAKARRERLVASGVVAACLGILAIQYSLVFSSSNPPVEKTKDRFSTEQTIDSTLYSSYVIRND